MKLTCYYFTPFIHAYVDGEFTDAERVEMEAHLMSCEDCRHQVELQVQMKQAVREHASVPTPAPFRADLLAMLAAEAEAMDVAEAETTRRLNTRRASMMAAPLLTAAAVLLVLPAFTVAPAASSSLPAVEQTLDWHRGNYPLEVRSPKTSTVASWFVGKVDFPVRLPQFDQPNARLLGARLAHVNNQKAAYALYDINGSRVSVMMSHGEGLKVPGDTIRTIADHKVALMNSKGYDIAVLQDDGVTYTITSELPREQFMQMMQRSLRP